MKTVRIFTINPVPASRPRVSRYGTYYLPTYRNFKTDFAAILRDEKISLMKGQLKVSIICHVKKPKTTERLYPIGDVDNYAKAVLDGLNGVMWDDDDQIIELSVTKQYNDGEGFISVEVTPVEGNVKKSMPKMRAVGRRH